MLESNISHLSSLRAEIEKQLLNMSVYEAYITDISVRAERFMQEKGIKALKKIGFKYISHSNYYANRFDANRDYNVKLPLHFMIEIESTKIGGQWKENNASVVSIDKRREALVAKMIKDFEELTGESIKINMFSLEEGSSPMIQILFK